MAHLLCWNTFRAFLLSPNLPFAVMLWSKLLVSFKLNFFNVHKVFVYILDEYFQARGRTT